MRRFRLAESLATAALFLSACSQSTIPGGPVTTTNTRETSVAAGHGSPMLYEVEEYGYSANAYPPSANGNVPPAMQIAGSQTKIYEPPGMAVDADGKVAVANSQQQITLYAPGANGNVAPLATITCGAGDPEQIAYDKNGSLYSLYVGGYHADVVSIEVYDPQHQAGCVNSTHIIVGSHAPLNAFGGLAVANGMIYNSGTAIEAYHTSDNGNIAPAFTISGSHTRLQSGNGIAVDSSGALYVANRKNVLIFAPGAHGNVAPAAILSGKKTGIPETGWGATAIAVDAKGEIFVAVDSDENVAAILVFAKGSNGNVAPIRTIQGASADLGYIPEMGFK